MIGTSTRLASSRASGVLVLGESEQQHGGNAHAGDVLGFLHELVDGEPALAGHRLDRLTHAAPVHGEHRVDEVVHAERRLADEPTEQAFFAKPSRAEHCMWHHSLLLAPRDSARRGLAPTRAKWSPSARARAGIV